MRIRSALPFALALHGTVLAAVAEVRYRAQVDYTAQTANFLSVDRDGSVLISTDSGIVRWDGTRMEQLLRATSVAVTHRDRRGNLWTGIDYPSPLHSRIVRIDPAGILQPLTSNTRVRDIAEDDAGAVWVATDVGLYAFDDTNLIYHPTLDPDSVGSSVNSLAFDDAGNLWLGTGGAGGVAKISPTRKVEYMLPGFYVESIRKAPDGAMWAATSGGLRRWNGSSWNLAESAGIHQIAFGSDGRLFGRADSSILAWNGTALDTLSKACPYVFGWMPLVSDGHGHILTSSGTGALLDMEVSTGQSTRRPLYEEGFPGRRVGSVLQDSLGNVWVTTDIGLSRFSTAGRRSFPLRTLHVAEPRSGEIWGADIDSMGIFWFSGDSIHHLAPHLFTSDVAASPNGEVAAAGHQVIYRFKGSSTPVAEPVDSISTIQAIGYCPDGKLLVAGDNSGNRVSWSGFWQPSGARWSRELSSGGTYGPTSLWCDGQGDVWFTEGGPSFFHRHGNTIKQLVPPRFESGLTMIPSPARHPYVVVPSGLLRPDAQDSLVPVPGWDSASVRAMGFGMSNFYGAVPAQGGGLWIIGDAQVLFLADSPWKDEVGVKPRTAAPSARSLEATRQGSSWNVTWSGTQAAELVAIDISGRTAWTGMVAPGGTVTLDRSERFLVLRATSAGVPAEVRKLAAP